MGLNLFFDKGKWTIWRLNIQGFCSLEDRVEILAEVSFAADFKYFLKGRVKKLKDEHIQVDIYQNKI